jgi:polyhydroxyalkanoate synthase
VNWTLFEQLDRSRRLQGAMMDAAGLGPAETLYETVYRAEGVSLRGYAEAAGSGPPVLIVPAPIKRPYIWDLSPAVSAVRRCLATPSRVFLVDWQRAAPEFGLGDYAEGLILDCLNAAGDEPAVVLAHSLGGLFAAVFAALHPDRVRGLVLLASPLHFAAGAGFLGALVARVDVEDLPDQVPGSFLSIGSFQASPATFGWDRWSDALLSLAEPAALRTHLQVERWMLDEFALPRRLFAELADLMLEDRFTSGTLQIGGRSASPSRLTAPLLCVVDPRCRIVPPEAVTPLMQAAGSGDKTLLHYTGDVGVSLQHVGPLVGRRAHAQLWPEILRWIGLRSRQ